MFARVRDAEEAEGRHGGRERKQLQLFHSSSEGGANEQDSDLRYRQEKNWKRSSCCATAPAGFNSHKRILAGLFS